MGGGEGGLPSIGNPVPRNIFSMLRNGCCCHLINMD